MLKIEIPTSALAVALTPEGDDVEPGPALATLLRKVADQVEGIRILPGNDEWIPEVHRVAQRVDGVLLGAVVTLDKEDSE